jgi:hypothetical protein
MCGVSVTDIKQCWIGLFLAQVSVLFCWLSLLCFCILFLFSLVICFLFTVLSLALVKSLVNLSIVILVLYPINFAFTLQNTLSLPASCNQHRHMTPRLAHCFPQLRDLNGLKIVVGRRVLVTAFKPSAYHGGAAHWVKMSSFSPPLFFFSGQ